MKRRVAFLIFPDFQLLDAAGPISAFEIAERYVPGSYELRVIAKQPGAVASTSGASMNAVALGRPAGDRHAHRRRAEKARAPRRRMRAR